MLIAAVVLAGGCYEPPGPGETKCRTSMIYGTAYTKCEQGPQVVQVQGAPMQPQQRAPEIWCTLSVEYGLCFPSPGECEAARTKYGVASFGACGRQAETFCQRNFCFATPADCADFERQSKRDGSACFKYPR